MLCFENCTRNYTESCTNYCTTEKLDKKNSVHQMNTTVNSPVSNPTKSMVHSNCYNGGATAYVELPPSCMVINLNISMGYSMARISQCIILLQMLTMYLTITQCFAGGWKLCIGGGLHGMDKNGIPHNPTGQVCMIFYVELPL